MPKVCASSFREYADIEENTTAVDGFGGIGNTWALKYNIWCMVQDTSGGESFIAGREEAVKGIQVTTHYISDVTTADRLTLDGVTYDITRIDNIDRRGVFMVLFCESEIV